jgi:peptidoglycan/xylan/chitin deacetylase (PgdA/CDA1 family)
VADARVALTFDAEHPSRPHCPPGATERILEALADAEVRATFFLQGRWVTAEPALARSVVDAGHLIGNHSHHHAPFSLLTPKGIRDDLSQAEDAIRRVTGAEPQPWFRFPFGDGDESPQIAEALASTGYRNVGWHVDPNDWDDARSAGDVERLVREEAPIRGDGAVVLLHAWPSTTPVALPGIISGLRANGARFVTVDELDPLPSRAEVRS